MKTRRILPVALAGLILWQFSAVPAEAAVKCARLVNSAGGETLVNSCNTCRIVNIQRKRPGTAAPVNRTLTVAPNTTTGLSFRGPGRSRILADTACRPKAVNKSGGDAPQAVPKSCVVMRRTVNSGISGLALANNCDECRLAVVSRLDAKGRKKMQNIAVGPRSQVPLAAMGAVQATILYEKSCRK